MPGISLWQGEPKVIYHCLPLDGNDNDLTMGFTVLKGNRSNSISHGIPYRKSSTETNQRLDSYIYITHTYILYVYNIFKMNPKCGENLQMKPWQRIKAHVVNPVPETVIATSVY